MSIFSRRFLLWLCSTVCALWTAFALVIVAIAGTEQAALPARGPEHGMAAFFFVLAALTWFASVYLAVRGANER